MKVLLLTTSEQTGGAAVAASRLAQALQRAGVDVHRVVRDKATDRKEVVSVNRSWWIRQVNFLRFVFERLVIFICNRLSRKNLFQVSVADTGVDISRMKEVKEADVIHLHWINQGFLSLADIKRLVDSGKPVVWTLHDLWPATGICHYPDRCTRYQEECHDCPLMEAHPLWDLARCTFRKKQKAGFDRIHYVGCSRWIARQAECSALLKGIHPVSIPNAIDSELFHPMDREAVRKRFGLPLDRKLVLFAAAKVSDRRKGADYLVEACRLLVEKRRERFEVVLMGNSPEELVNLFPVPIHTLGYLSDAASIASAYSCADLFVIPSLEDNLPNTIMEAMACGTPCVGFRTGGIPEMIDHQVNGYVADYKDAGDLAAGISWVLAHREDHRLSEEARCKVERNYSEAVVARRYISFYNELLNKQ